MQDDKGTRVKAGGEKNCNARPEQDKGKNKKRVCRPKITGIKKPQH